MILIVEKQLTLLKKQTRKSQQQAYAEGTFKNLNNQWVKYLKFCVYFDLTALPASTAVLSWYAQHLSSSLRAHASIIAYLAGVKTLHKLLSLTTVGFTGFHLKLTLQGLRRTNKHKTQRARPMTPALLRKIHQQLDFRNTDHILFWGVCIIGFFLLFRKSNLIPDTKTGFLPGKQLRKKDICLTKTNAVVGIRWAKNEQFF